MIDAMILSNALDTNGQNARYVEAARKHGDHPDVIEALAIGRSDPAGVVGRFQEAAEKHDLGIRIRSANKAVEYFEFPSDLRWGPGASRAQNAEVRTLVRAADLIHLNNSEAGLRYFGFSVQKKPMLLHHHGSLFRSNPQKYLDMAKSRKMVQAVSTPDLQRPAPDVLHWLPTAYDIKSMADFGARHRREPDGRIRIGHFTTNRDGKHTDLFVAVIRQLQEEGLPIDLVPSSVNVIRPKPGQGLPKMPWHSAMALKATCDIVYDQLTWGYGCNSVEAWAMGIPVVSGADEWTTERMKAMWGDLPYENATEATLKAVIRRMVASEDVRAGASARGQAHVLRFHDELPALEILAGLYHDAIKVKVRPRIEGKGIQFRSTKATNKVLHVDGVMVQFKDGVAMVTDQAAADGLRRMAKARPKYGIEEVA